MTILYWEKYQNKKREIGAQYIRKQQNNQQIATKWSSVNIGVDGETTPVHPVVPPPLVCASVCNHPLATLCVCVELLLAVWQCMQPCCSTEGQWIGQCVVPAYMCGGIPYIVECLLHPAHVPNHPANCNPLSPHGQLWPLSLCYDAWEPLLRCQVNSIKTSDCPPLIMFFYT